MWDEETWEITRNFFLCKAIVAAKKKKKRDFGLSV